MNLPDSQHTLQEIRKILAEREPCSPGCPGWAIMDSDSRGTEIERCDACFYGLPQRQQLYDEDVALLPEAQEALRKALKEST